MTPKEKLQECKLVLSTIDKAGLLTSTSNQLRWLIARVEQLEEALHEVQSTGFLNIDDIYRICSKTLSTGPKPDGN